MHSRIVAGAGCMQLQGPAVLASHPSHAVQGAHPLRWGTHQHLWAPMLVSCPHQAPRHRQIAYSSSSDNWQAAWSSNDDDDSNEEGSRSPWQPPARPLRQPAPPSDSLMQPNTSPSNSRPQSMPSVGPNHLAAFKAFQQMAPLQEGPALSTGPIRTPRSNSGTTRVQSLQQTAPYTGGRGGPGSEAGWRRPRDRTDRDLPPGAHLSMFRKVARNTTRQVSYAGDNLSVQELYEVISNQAQRSCPGPAPLFLLVRNASCAEHMRTALSACVLVRSAQARFNEELRAVGGPRLAVAFAEACVRCDAPDVMASALMCANEAGLVFSYAAVLDALKHWAQTHEMHKVVQVLQAMQAGGLPYTTRTAYVAIRGAVNSGRMDMAEQMAQMFQEQGVRMHDTTLRLLELGRQRAQARQRALEAVSAGPAQAP